MCAQSQRTHLVPRQVRGAGTIIALGPMQEIRIKSKRSMSLGLEMCTADFLGEKGRASRRSRRDYQPTVNTP